MLDSQLVLVSLNLRLEVALVFVCHFVNGEALILEISSLGLLLSMDALITVAIHVSVLVHRSHPADWLDLLLD